MRSTGSLNNWRYSGILLIFRRFVDFVFCSLIEVEVHDLTLLKLVRFLPSVFVNFHRLDFSPCNT